MSCFVLFSFFGGGGAVGRKGGDGAEGAGTALQLTRALLSKEGAGPRKKGLQEVARQLSAAAAALERAKEHRERKEREAKVCFVQYHPVSD